MTVRHILMGVAFLCMASTARAQEIQEESLVSVPADSTSAMPDSVPVMSGIEYNKIQESIWKRRTKFFYLGYGFQNLKSDYRDLKSDMSITLTTGRTFYLHKKPLAGMIKFGLDWKIFDINFAMYPDLTSEPEPTFDEEEELADLGIMQLEAGMGLGPSFTINPIDHLKLALFFHVTPSYSLIMQNSELYHHYATFLNIGMTVSYKAISIGFENRWCRKTEYGGVTMDRIDDIYDDQGVFHDPFEAVGQRMKTRTFRLYIGFRY